MTLNYHSAPVEPGQQRSVSCEKCGCEYTFSVPIRLLGMTWKLFTPGDKADLAREAAREAQRRYLSEPAACPDCGWYQKLMVWELRRRHHGWMSTLGRWMLYGVFSFAVAVPVLALKLSARGESSLVEAVVYTPVAAILGCTAVALALLAAVLLVVRSRLANAYDPNALYPQRSPPRPNEPVATRTPAYQRRVELRELAAGLGGLAVVPWYYLGADGRHGPVSLGELADLVAGGVLQPDDFVWARRLSGWVPLRELLRAVPAETNGTSETPEAAEPTEPAEHADFVDPVDPVDPADWADT